MSVIVRQSFFMRTGGWCQDDARSAEIVDPASKILSDIYVNRTARYYAVFYRHHVTF